MNILVLIAIVLVVLVLSIWLIQMLSAAIHAPAPIGLLLQVVAVLAAIVFICKKAGWF